jgi:hypothetical protein
MNKVDTKCLKTGTEGTMWKVVIDFIWDGFWGYSLFLIQIHQVHKVLALSALSIQSAGYSVAQFFYAILSLKLL